MLAPNTDVCCCLHQLCIYWGRCSAAAVEWRLLPGAVTTCTHQYPTMVHVANEYLSAQATSDQLEFD